MKVICTSFKDSIAFTFITGVVSYNYQGEKVRPKKEDLEEGTTHIVIDNDSTGEEFGNHFAKWGIKVIRPIGKDVFEDWKKLDREMVKEYYLNCLK